MMSGDEDGSLAGEGAAREVGARKRSREVPSKRQPNQFKTLLKTFGTTVSWDEARIASKKFGGAPWKTGPCKSGQLNLLCALHKAVPKSYLFLN